MLERISLGGRQRFNFAPTIRRVDTGLLAEYLPVCVKSLVSGIQLNSLLIERCLAQLKILKAIQGSPVVAHDVSEFLHSLHPVVTICYSEHLIRRLNFGFKVLKSTFKRPSFKIQLPPLTHTLLDVQKGVHHLSSNLRQQIEANIQGCDCRLPLIRPVFEFILRRFESGNFNGQFPLKSFLLSLSLLVITMPFAQVIVPLSTQTNPGPQLKGLVRLAFATCVFQRFSQPIDFSITQTLCTLNFSLLLCQFAVPLDP